MSDDGNNDTTIQDMDAPSFEMGDYHKKALVILLHLYHGNRQTLTYSQLSFRLGVGEKTKAWQCVAWKDLKSNEYIVPLSSDKKQWELSDKGVKLASTLLSDEELADFAEPDTNEKLHENIKNKMARDNKARRYGGKILDIMLAPNYVPLTRHEMAAKLLNTLADSHGFFYGMKWLKDNGYVEDCDAKVVAELKAMKEANIVTPASSFEEEDEEEEGSTGDNKKRKSENAMVDEESDPKKKKYKSTKKRSVGNLSNSPKTRM